MYMNECMITDDKKRIYITEGIFKDYLIQKYIRKVKTSDIKLTNINNNRTMPEHDINIDVNYKKKEIVKLIKKFQKSDEVIKKDTPKSNSYSIFIEEKEYTITTVYILKRFIWTNILIDLILDYDYKITNHFYYFLQTYPDTFFNNVNNLNKKKKIQIKLTKNHLLIFDALLYIGGYSAKYKKSSNRRYKKDTVSSKIYHAIYSQQNGGKLKKFKKKIIKKSKKKKSKASLSKQKRTLFLSDRRDYNLNKKHFLYSEHSGMMTFDYDKKRIASYLINNNNYVTYKGDDSLFFPDYCNKFKNFEYIFHTHPPTPYPGDRAATEGLLYEWPSISDLYHFSQHYNNGITHGEIIFAPEGIYLIRPYFLNNKVKKINISENNIKVIRKIIWKLQDDAIELYKMKYYEYERDSDFYYSKVCQNTLFLNKLNMELKKINIFIDYFPKINYKGEKRWIYDSVRIYVYI